MINIILCVKVVLSDILYKDNNIVDKYMLNPFDLYALELVLEIKRTTECKITCLCMGKEEIKEALVQCKAMGADDIILLSDKKFAGADTYATVYVLAQALKNLDYDIVVCGKQAVDGETGQVPYGLAARLNCICMGAISEIEVLEKNRVIVTQQKDNIKRKLACKLPIVMTYDDCTLKSPTINLMALKRAEKYQVTILKAQDLNLDTDKVGQQGSKTEVYSSTKPEYRKAEPILLQDEMEEMISKIYDILRIRKG